MMSLNVIVAICFADFVLSESHFTYRFAHRFAYVHTSFFCNNVRTWECDWLPK